MEAGCRDESSKYGTCFTLFEKEEVKEQHFDSDIAVLGFEHEIQKQHGVMLRKGKGREGRAGRGGYFG